MKEKGTILRGKILEFLRHMYPEGVDERTLMGVFYQYHKYDAILASLAYMNDKGYILKTEVPHPYKTGETLKVYKASPEGIDLFEGTITDPAVFILHEGA